MSADGSNSTLRTQELLVEFLASSHADAEGAFEALCAAHPSQAETLRRLYAACDARVQLEFPDAITDPRAVFLDVLYVAATDGPENAQVRLGLRGGGGATKGRVQVNRQRPWSLL